MIRYALACSLGHAFEAWFGSSDAYDRQAGDGEIVCPVCGGTHVEKAPMAPFVARASRAEEPPARERRKTYAMLRKLRKELTADSDDVGPRFPEEARKIHYEEAPARAIHGQATSAEARELGEEGIPILPLPPLPDDEN